MKITASNLLRWAGLSAMVAGISFVVVGLLHPPQILSSVTTGTWLIVHLLTIAVSFFGLLGIAGIYARQVEAVGWLGLAGFALFGFGAVSSVAFALLPPALEPLATVPVGVGLAWLGYAIWSERREPASQRMPATKRAQLRPTPAA